MPSRTPARPREADSALLRAQRWLGVICHLTMYLPYVRRVEGAEVLRGSERKIFAANHVSLLDTPLLGSVLRHAGRSPILVLGDRGVWHQSWFRRLLSAKVGFLIDRDGPTKARLREMSAYGRSIEDFELILFPEGTRGDGRSVLPCQPGIFFVARAAKAPIVPVFIAGMAGLSSKDGGLHLWRARRSVDVHFGPEILPEEYEGLDREQMAELVRERIAALIPAELRSS